MANNQANIKAVITADDKASGVLKKFSSHLDGIGSTLATGLKATAVGLATVTTAVGAFGAASVKAFTDSENAQAQLNAVLKSTHGVAGLVIDDLNAHAQALQKVTRYDDEAINGAQALLLTFTDLKGPVVKQATETVLDMSTALGQDLKSSSVQLGKALQDPILGITALRRVGVNFNDAQKDVIENLVNTGRKAEAQQLILKELQTEFGGSARAAGDTFAGSLDKLKNAFNDIQETIGKTIVQYLVPLVQKLAEFAAKVDWDAVIKTTIATISSLIQTLTSLYRSLVDYLSPGIGRFIETLTKVATTLVTVLTPPINALVEAFKTRLLPSLIELYNALEPGLTTVLKFLAQVIGVVLVAALWASINVLNVAITVFGGVVHAISNVVKWYGEMYGKIIEVFRGIPTYIREAFSGLKDILVKPFNDAFDIIKRGINDVKDTFNRVKDGITSAPGKVGARIKSLIPGFAAGTNFAPGGMAVVGEQGPELVDLPRGSKVIPNPQISTAAPTINISVNAGAFMGTNMEARKFAQTILDNMRDIAGSKSMSLDSYIKM